MFKAALVRVVEACRAMALPVVIVYAVVGGLAAVYAARDFRISTDTERLLPDDLSWRRHELAYQRLFPPHRVLAVIDAATPERADRAADGLLAGLERVASDAGPIRSATPLGFGAFYARDGLMLAPLADARRLAERIEAARPLLEAVAPDPTLAGFARAASEAAAAEAAGRAPSGGTGSLLSDAAASLGPDGARHPFSPAEAFGAAPKGRAATERVIAIDPVLDFKALEPGLAATDLVRAQWRRLAPATRGDARLAVTGEVPVNDEQFGAVQHGQAVGLAVTVVLVGLIFFAALRSIRIIAAVALSLACGFALTCAVALLLVGSFNLLSIAFAILFVGLGADFGIQFSVRYRDERHRAERESPSRADPLGVALRRSATRAGVPLALAAVSTSVGFFSFLPTQYKGVSELGLIAGIGMLIAFATTVTLLPALLTLFRPPGEARPMGFSALAPLDRFLARHRIAVIVCTLGGVLLASPLLASLRFDFDPTHMQIQSGEAVATFHRLQADPASGVEALDIARPDLAAATAVASRLDRQRLVSSTRTAALFVTADPEAHAALTRTLRDAVGPLFAAPVRPSPDDAETVAALRRAAETLTRAAGEDAARAPSGDAASRAPSGATASRAPSGDPASRAPSGNPASRAPSGATASRAPSGATASRAPSGATASRAPSGDPASRAPSGATAHAPAGAAALGRAFRRLADGDRAGRDRARAILLPPLATDLDRLRLMLDATPVTAATLPEAVRREWVAPNGASRVEILPAGDTARNVVLARFARAVLGIAPDASGNPVTLLGWRRTVITAFAEAGLFAIVAIAVVLALVLRKPRDVLLTLLPLLIAGLVTLELAVVLGIELNFANIIALPLLLGVGVAFKIYYVMAWREGVTDLLQSTLTRAVVFSAATTGTAFGSLWLSPQPGTSSMGKLMALALCCTLAAAVLFQPALMGPPRRKGRDAPGQADRSRDDGQDAERHHEAAAARQAVR